MNGSVRSACLLLLVFLLSNCGHDPAARPAHRVSRTSEEGVLVIRNLGGPKYEGELFDYERVLEIREDEIVSESLMGEIVLPRYGPDGDYYLLDMMAGRIVVFGPDGVFQRAIGRQGEGPGELMAPSEFTFHGGTLNVSQSMPLRLTRFRLDGSVQDVMSWPAWSLGNRIPRLDITVGGEILGYFFDRKRGDRFVTMSVTVVVARASGDTMAVLSGPEVATDEIVHLDLGQGTLAAPLPLNLTGQSWCVYSPHHGVVMSGGIDPELQCYRPDGTLEKRIRLEAEPEPINAADRAVLQAAYNQAIARVEQEPGGSGALRLRRLRVFRDNAPWAETRASWTWFEVDLEGWFWLLRPAIEVIGAEFTPQRIVRVIDAEGEYLGDTTLPSAPRFAFAHDRFIRQEDDPVTGGRIWVVYRMVPRVPGLRFP
jgi:hypothetical protein